MQCCSSWKPNLHCFVKEFLVLLAVLSYGKTFCQVISKSNSVYEFLCGISPTHSQRQRYLFLYLFIYLSTDRSARHVVSSLGVSTWEDWAPVYYVLFMFRGRPLLFSAVGFLLILKIFRAVLLVYKVRRSRFPFWRFPWVYLSLNFLYNLKFWLQNIPIDRRKPTTFAAFLSALFLIWDFSSVISPGVYNRRSVCHRSCLALFTSKQSSPWTFRFDELKLYV